MHEGKVESGANMDGNAPELESERQGRQRIRSSLPGAC